ncbi:hypothetical protein E2C01_080137 [Portunus trituberculatus]|uniref:Uncharacterized protein n=1 Tax=Portunus trituberculatus TaxID=210409 RepID=A0A5B7IUM4_PORTR|nr:hypothetical protein [Portunus trituberculatus]
MFQDGQEYKKDVVISFFSYPTIFSIFFRATVQQMVGFVSKIKDSYDAAEKRHQQKEEQKHKEWETKLASVSKDHSQTKEELKKTEGSFFELVK